MSSRSITSMPIPTSSFIGRDDIKRDELGRFAAEASAKAKAHESNEAHHTREIVRGAKGEKQQKHADARHHHGTAKEHYTDASGHYTAGREQEGHYSMGQGKYFGEEGNRLSRKLGHEPK